MKNKKSLIALICCLALIVGGIGATLAWLTAQTGTVTNTFTSAKLFDDPTDQFKLYENKVKDPDNDGKYEFDEETTSEGNEYTILPGVEIPKNPTIEVAGLKERAYLFVEVTDTLVDGLSFSMDDNWVKLDGKNVYVYVNKPLTDESGVIQASEGEGVKSFTANVIKEQKILVSPEYEPVDNSGELKFKAYMIQATGNGSNAAEAWANAGN